MKIITLTAVVWSQYAHAKGIVACIDKCPRFGLLVGGGWWLGISVGLNTPPLYLQLPAWLPALVSKNHISLVLVYTEICNLIKKCWHIYPVFTKRSWKVIKKKSIFGGKIKQNNEVLNGAEYIQAVNSAIGWKTLVS